MNVGQTNVSTGEIRIERDGFLKIGNGFLDLAGALVPVIVSLHVERVGLGIAGLVLDERSSLFVCQADWKGVGDLRRHEILQFEDVGIGLVELASPALRASVYVDQSHGDPHAAVRALHAAIQHGVDIE